MKASIASREVAPIATGADFSINLAASKASLLGAGVVADHRTWYTLPHKIVDSCASGLSISVSNLLWTKFRVFRICGTDGAGTEESLLRCGGSRRGSSLESECHPNTV